MNPTSCLLGSRFVYNPFFILAGALLFVEKIRQRAALFWFGLRVVGLFYSRTVIQRIIVDFLPFLKQGLAEKIAVCVHNHRNPNKQKVGLIFE
jgi:hypothetical protein